MAAVLLAGGEPGMRGSLPNAEIMIHQPLGGGFGQASDISIINAQVQKCKNKLYNILARDTGNSFEKIMEDADRDYWMSAAEAQAYGLVDKVFTNKGIL
jgi:ATP-dependent Clp protease protease subunit